jgi:hypothetical protein
MQKSARERIWLQNLAPQSTSAYPQTASRQLAMRDPAVYRVDDQEDGHREVPNVLAHGPGEGSCKVCLWSKHCGGTLIVRSAVQHSMLRNYASLECDAFPQITQIASRCTLGTRRIPQMCTSEVVAADTKRAAFQQLQGYITT